MTEIGTLLTPWTTTSTDVGVEGGVGGSWTKSRTLYHVRIVKKNSLYF